MNMFETLAKKGPKTHRARKSYTISDEMYDKLVYLSKFVYDASINKLICCSVENFLNKSEVNLYSSEKSPASKRIVYLKQETFEKLEALRTKYGISISKLIDIAIHDALVLNSDYIPSDWYEYI